MSTCKLTLTDIRYIFNIIIPTWNHKLVKTKWNELKSKYTDDEIVRVLNENKENEIIIAIIKILYKEIKNVHDCEKGLTKLIKELIKEQRALEKQLSTTNDEPTLNYFNDLIKKNKTIITIIKIVY